MKNGIRLTITLIQIFGNKNDGTTTCKTAECWLRTKCYRRLDQFGRHVVARHRYGYRGDWLHEKLTFIVYQHGNTHLTPAEIPHKINNQRNVVQEMIAELVCKKPAREPLRQLQTSPQIFIQLG